jgi:exopolysaccharide biosynthesis polyprenyl glycosylphosphotransferase
LFKPDLFEIRISNVKSAEVGQIPLIELKDIPLEGWGRAIKRFIDILFSIFILIILSPIFILTSILVKITSRGPIFYKQKRTGLDGKNFNTLKFRSMYVTGSDGGAELKTGPTRTQPDDERRTMFGKFIRRLSIDELPQLINVLRGQMSLVGPRPERPEFVKIYKKKISGYGSRHRVKPGITGWAQVNGLRGFTSIEDRTRYDIYYIENWSLFLDLKIIFKTFGVVIKGRDAY